MSTMIMRSISAMGLTLLLVLVAVVDRDVNAASIITHLLQTKDPQPKHVRHIRQTDGGVESFGESSGDTASNSWCGGHEPDESELMHVRNVEVKRFNQYHRRRSVEGQPQLVIPIVWHMITSESGLGTLSTAQISQQISVLNDAFAGRDPDADTEDNLPSIDSRIRFRLERIEAIANNAYFDCRPGSAGAIANTLADDTTLYLNVYSCDIEGNTMGFVPQFPWTRGESDKRHGAFITYSVVPQEGGGGGHYNRGDILVHELGHYFGLFHTFQGGCGDGNGNTDYCSDTPAEDGPHSNCPGGNSCTADDDFLRANGIPTRDPDWNFMSYSTNFCQSRFSLQQVQWMRYYLNEHKASLVQSSVCTENCGNLPTIPPEANRAYQGELLCGQAVNGNTIYGLNTGGQPAKEHHYSFTVNSVGEHIFNACSSQYDTWLRIYRDTDENGIPDSHADSEIISCDDCGGNICGTPGTRTYISTGSPISNGVGGQVNWPHLPIGNYVIVIEGWGYSEGSYELTFQCPNGYTETAKTGQETTTLQSANTEQQTTTLQSANTEQQTTTLQSAITTSAALGQPPLNEYVLALAGGCFPSGELAAIASPVECNNAANFLGLLETRPLIERERDNHPTGCYYHVRNDKVFFNSAGVETSSNTGRRSICKVLPPTVSSSSTSTLASATTTSVKIGATQPLATTANVAESTMSPSSSPTVSVPSTSPSKVPSISDPTMSPSEVPRTLDPTTSPSGSPSTSDPTTSPSEVPRTLDPTTSPSESPSTSDPTMSPSEVSRTLDPTTSPSGSPSRSRPATQSSQISTVFEPEQAQSTAIAATITTTTAIPTLSINVGWNMSSTSTSDVTTSSLVSTHIQTQQPSLSPSIHPTFSLPTLSPSVSTFAPTTLPLSLPSLYPTSTITSSIPSVSPSISPTSEPKTSTTFASVTTNYRLASAFVLVDSVDGGCGGSHYEVISSLEQCTLAGKELGVIDQESQARLKEKSTWPYGCFVKPNGKTTFNTRGHFQFQNGFTLLCIVPQSSSSAPVSTILAATVTSSSSSSTVLLETTTKQSTSTTVATERPTSTTVASASTSLQSLTTRTMLSSTSKSTLPEFSLMNDGTCSPGYVPILAQDMCSAAAISLGLIQDAADYVVKARLDKPQGCYWRGGSRLIFNSVGRQMSGTSSRIICQSAS